MLQKRKHIRVGKLFSLELRVKPDEDQRATPRDWNMASANNLSTGGAFFYYNKDLEIGSFVDLRIFVPESKTSLYCTGKIIRAKKNIKPSIYDIAVEFTEINEQTKEIIEKFFIKSPG